MMNKDSKMSKNIMPASDWLKNLKTNFSHAYLILGPAKIGKMIFAEKIAHFLLSENLGLNSPDLSIIEPIGDKNPTISIEEVQKLRQASQLTSAQGGNKVIIIQNAHLMTLPAQNAILKTLEEPPAKTFLILTAISKKSILPTIVSRCQRIRLNLFSETDIRNLIGNRVPKPQADLIVHFSQGAPGVVMSFLDNTSQIDQFQEIFLQIGKAILTSDVFVKFQIADEFSKIKPQDKALNIVEIFYRELLLAKINPDYQILKFLESGKIERILTKYETVKIIKILQQILETKIALTQNINPRLAFENLVLAL